MTEIDGPNGEAQQAPRGRVSVDGLSRRPFDHANVLAALAVCICADGKIHMHCSIDGAALLDILEIAKERYYVGPMRANLARGAALAEAQAIVVPNGKVIGG